MVQQVLAAKPPDLLNCQNQHGGGKVPLADCPLCAIYTCVHTEVEKDNLKKVS